MSRIRYYMIAFFMILLLTGCGQKQAEDAREMDKTEEAGMTPDEIAEAIAESQENLPEFEKIRQGDPEFASYLSDYYLLSEGQIEDGVICCADGVEAGEIAVLVLADEKDMKSVQESLTEYIRNRAGVFEGYAPQQAAMAKRGITAFEGRYAALLICPDPAAARTAFSGCFGEQENRLSLERSIPEAVAKRKEPEEESAGKADARDSYDSAAVLQAWTTGDESSLSGINVRILHAARDVIQQEIEDTMSDYEKELAIHDWITHWSSFDYSVFSRSSSGGLKEGSDTPYGVLIDRRAMCHGYSTTFQLFMDMLGIECITVYGTPSSSGVQHSWNMVRLDQEWYCVDVAWDDPIGGTPGHYYFNATSQDFRESGIHRWDEESVPEAKGTAYRYEKQ